jgi:hypothetical protein
MSNWRRSPTALEAFKSEVVAGASVGDIGGRLIRKDGH